MSGRWSGPRVMGAWRQAGMVLLPFALVGSIAYASVVAMDNSRCAPIDVAYETTTLTEREIDWLYATDYRGNPQDGGEMLYAPGCLDDLIVWYDGRSN